MLRILYDVSPMNPAANERGLQAFHGIKKQILEIMKDVNTERTEINIVITFPTINESPISFVGTDAEVAVIVLAKYLSQLDLKGISDEISTANNN